ncbi:hypothetical protein TNCV_3780651 [Trichonephila clavipes]|nr:hypothetical protein TNCV_3780651 [Trichonephila clavipes]
MDTRRYPRAENRSVSGATRKTTRERMEGSLLQALVDYHGDSFNDYEQTQASEQFVPQTISRHLAKQILNPSAL